MRKIVIEKQHDLTDCGPACLSSIIKYYGGHVPISLIREHALTDTSGTSAYNLIECAKKYGFSSKGIKLKNLNELYKLKLPLISHVKLENGLYHFVVVYKIYKDSIYIMDPQSGKRKVTLSDFQDIFTNVCILLYPLSKIVKYKTPKSILNIFKETFVKNKKSTIILFTISVLLIIISIFINYFIKIIDYVISSGFGFAFLISFILIFLILNIIKNILEYLKNKLIIYLNKNISCTLYSNFSQKLFNLPLSFIKSKTSGEIISRYNELSEINELLPSIILSTFIDLIMSTIAILFGLIISYKLTLIIIFCMLIYLFIGFAFKNPTLQRIDDNINKKAQFNSEVIENINNLRSTKYLNNESNMEKRMGRYGVKSLYNNYNLGRYFNRIGLFKNLFYDLSYYVIISYGLYLNYIHSLSVVDLFTFLMIINYFTEPVRDFVDMISKICFIKSSINKINEFSIIQEENKSLTKFKNGDIKISNLNYAYNGLDYTIKNFNCLIKKGSKVLVQGPSGSGKSTLCQIIAKQLKDYEGNILINNFNIEKINEKSLRSKITYIGQKDSLMVDTIENNIKFERNVDENQFKTICNICEIDKIIKNKFDCYQTLICESQDNISGGEKQRISLARGLINSGKIIIMDESLSEVNKDMEERIIRNIFKYFKKKTVIYVSHKSYKNIFDQKITVGG